VPQPPGEDLRVLVDRLGERLFMVGGLTLQAFGMGWIALTAEPGLSYPELVLPSIVASVVVSMAIASAQNPVVGAVAENDLGKAAGAKSMMRELGGVFGSRSPSPCSQVPAVSPRPTTSSTVRAGDRGACRHLLGRPAVALALSGPRPGRIRARRSRAALEAGGGR
jgi:hypothetical protein